MYSSWQIIAKYLRYYLAASNGKGHGIHSPFIFNFIKEVLNDRADYPDYKTVESLRAALLNNHQSLKIEDFGAGSQLAKTNTRTVSSIVKHAAKSKKLSRLLYRLAKYYQPSTMLELGTSLGISSAYFSLANRLATVYTVEGASSVAEQARENFRMLGLENIEMINGNFDEVLPGLLPAIGVIDLAFIDGNHQYGPTLNYFKLLLPKLRDNSILIFDDIHWSEGMERAWREIREHSSVKCTVDLFFIGIVFFREEFREKQHFTIRF